MTFETEIHRRVHDNENGFFLTVRPSVDFEGNVLLLTEESQEEYFGNVRLDLPAEFMRQLGEALIAASKEAEAA